ncbi:MAG: hypothetical protein HRT54_18200 [Colwellia sp.]|nr:hypothetical protein [Colwellia sp.]
MGYELGGKQFTVIPEIKYGPGSMGSEGGIELKKYISLSVKGKYQYQNGIYLFLYPSYSKFTFEQTSRYVTSTYTLSETSSEFGIGTGVGYEFTPSFSVEASFEKIDGNDPISFGLRYKF